MKISDLVVGDLVGVQGILNLLKKATLPLSFNEAVGVKDTASWLQSLAENMSETFKAEQSSPKTNPPGDPGFTIKEYQPIPNGPKVKSK